MKEGNAVGAFSMFSSDKVRLIRLRQIGSTHSGQSFFGLARFKIYGSLLSRDFEEGLIARQTQECGKNVHDAGLVVYSASGKCDEWPAKNAAHPGLGSTFFSEDKPDQWMCYNFRRKKVQRIGYLLRTAADCWNLKEWVIEGSQDGTTWTKLCNEHNEKNRVINQKFSIACDNFFGMLRQRHTENNYIGQHQLGVEFLDGFGRIIYEESPSNSPRQPDWDCVPDLTSPLSTKKFGDMIGRCFPELRPAQVTELVWRFFPGLNAMRAVALTREVIPVLTAGQAIELLQEFFSELDAPQIIGLVRRIECPAFQTVMKGVFRKESPMKKVKI
jgi:hypothetical protein